LNLHLAPAPELRSMHAMLLFRIGIDVLTHMLPAIE
jgi:hypothetical protein